LHPPVDRHMINVHATLGEQFCNVSVRESVAQVPAHRQHDHVRPEPVAGERNRDRTAAANHQGTLRLAPDRSTQQCRGESVAEADEFAVDAPVAPRRVLRCQPDNETPDLGCGGWPSGSSGGLCPVAGDASSVTSRQGVGGDEPPGSL
jgi:hypothetical protein